MYGYHTNTEGEIFGYHLNVAKKARVVPGPQRHKWDGKPQRNKPATCDKCGCEQLWWMGDTWYRLKGTTEKLPRRPDCTGTPAADE